ncbi:guanyl-specific ribonuclease Sa [Saccharomonospora amisosensis]|uniref:Guanyl-specific ribonuclease Sa n=1 Tax=Saccharomonospora amisosensis TaxID=1128677 RepID=A0A7X5US76_9PSEU|nr:ribonuclease domain-containing protein [Saccharomonospora amisosensis]NIJ13251.1 guanyl-specific ribonuclease Sa [Saccharomonospora amisosensis]
MLSRRRISAALIGLILLVIAGWLVKDVLAVGEPRHGTGSLPGADSGLEVAPLSSPPPQAERTWTLIERGGPFPHPDTDGTTFGNRESSLPQMPAGHYKQYTVDLPGTDGRGPRGLVTGQHEEVYYTGDHYVSFVVVDTQR